MKPPGLFHPEQFKLKMLFNATPDVWLIEQLPPVGS
jgi:hypothetical protein